LRASSKAGWRGMKIAHAHREISGAALLSEPGGMAFACLQCGYAPFCDDAPVAHAVA
jgi:hypothetical protein